MGIVGVGCCGVGGVWVWVGVGGWVFFGGCVGGFGGVWVGWGVGVVGWG